jgi:hypothetical protein
VPNRATAARQAAIAESGMTPLDYMISVFRDENQPVNVRLDAARSAAGYVHPRLASVGIGNDGGQPIQVQILRFSDIGTDDELAAEP